MRAMALRTLTAGACLRHSASLMLEKIQTLLTLLGIISVLAVVAERVRFPFPILLVIAGLLIAMSPRLPEVKLDPELVFLIFLPPLLFSAAWNFPWENLRSNFVPIFALAAGLVFATIVCVAYVGYWLVPGMTLATGFVLGAIVSPPDAVAATAVFEELARAQASVCRARGRESCQRSGGISVCCCSRRDGFVLAGGCRSGLCVDVRRGFPFRAFGGHGRGIPASPSARSVRRRHAHPPYAVDFLSARGEIWIFRRPRSRRDRPLYRASLVGSARSGEPHPAR